MLNLKEVGKRIKEVRGKQTQTEFAERVGRTQTKISRLEKGHVKYLPMNLIYRICKETTNPINLEWLFTGEGNKFMSTPVVPVDYRLKKIVLSIKDLLAVGDFAGLAEVESCLRKLKSK